MEPQERVSRKLFCKFCKDVIQSRHVHDLQTCSCRQASIDGGSEYTRILGGLAGMVLFVHESEIERRSVHCISEHCSWTEIRLKSAPVETDNVFCPYHGVYELARIQEASESRG